MVERLRPEGPTVMCLVLALLPRGGEATATLAPEVDPPETEAAQPSATDEQIYPDNKNMTSDTVPGVSLESNEAVLPILPAP